MNKNLRRRLSLIYWWMKRNFIYNKLNQRLFFPNGYSKKINGEVIKLPFRYSWVYSAIYEKEKANLIRTYCKPGSVAIDIGAHMGIFSFFLAKQVGSSGRVYSFEPTPLIFDVLRETIKYNHVEHIIDARRWAVANTQGEILFNISQHSKISNANSITLFDDDYKYKSIMVNVVKLDDLMNDEDIKNISFIKIDAEGAEFEILKGGMELLKKYRPFITLEVHPGTFAIANKLKEIFDFIIELGYSIKKDNRRLTVDDFCGFKHYFEVFLLPGNLS